MLLIKKDKIDWRYGHLQMCLRSNNHHIRRVSHHPILWKLTLKEFRKGWGFKRVTRENNPMKANLEFLIRGWYKTFYLVSFLKVLNHQFLNILIVKFSQNHLETNLIKLKPLLAANSEIVPALNLVNFARAQINLKQEKA